MGYGQYDGETPIRTRNTDIAALKQQAMDELSAIGVTFPVHCTWPILAGATNQQDTAVVLRQCFSDSLGDDFVVLDIIEYVSSITQEIVNATGIPLSATAGALTSAIPSTSWARRSCTTTTPTTP